MSLFNNNSSKPVIYMIKASAIRRKSYSNMPTRELEAHISTEAYDLGDKVTKLGPLGVPRDRIEKSMLTILAGGLELQSRTDRTHSGNIIVDSILPSCMEKLGIK